MRTQVDDLFQIKYRNFTIDDEWKIYKTKINDPVLADEHARAYATLNPDTVVWIVSKSRGFVKGYKFISLKNSLHYTYGNSLWVDENE